MTKRKIFRLVLGYRGGLLVPTWEAQEILPRGSGGCQGNARGNLPYIYHRSRENHFSKLGEI